MTQRTSLLRGTDTFMGPGGNLKNAAGDLALHPP
jgi:hypothetical protein